MIVDSKHKKRVEQQFDAYCKKVVQNASRDICEKEKIYNKHNVSLEFNLTLANEVSTWDCYEPRITSFNVHGYTAFIEDETIAKAIAKLPQKQRDVILLAFFTHLKDAKIATMLGITPSTLHYHKTSALNSLHKSIKMGDLK